MANPEIKVVPFIGQIKTGVFSSEGPPTASKQLEDAIQQQVGQGWEFVELAQINILTQPGCLAGLFGAAATVVVYDQLIFQRQR